MESSISFICASFGTIGLTKSGILEQQEVVQVWQEIEKGNKEERNVM